MATEEPKVENKLAFKTVASYFNSKTNGNKKKTWKSLKQIISSEKTLPWPENTILYSSINAPPSFRPPEKFSDLSGLPAPYTDPATRLRYANKEEYSTILGLPMDITAGYLALRGASSIVGNERSTNAGYTLCAMMRSYIIKWIYKKLLIQMYD
ncbi:hypothetical protein HHI36_017436 [Cryptolaemus montrouzieri]|uniref:Vps72/YL1 C-terminal domain-containing protein n=1 Tax=Cryptolaemus montrouzieri TaxID=559131 RepID=A0ABD2NMW2_9CUCU